VNIGSLLTSSAASHPKSPAIVHGSLTMDYEQFNARVNRLSNALRRLGARPGDNVAILMVNCPQMLSRLWSGPHQLPAPSERVCIHHRRLGSVCFDNDRGF